MFAVILELATSSPSIETLAPQEASASARAPQTSIVDDEPDPSPIEVTGSRISQPAGVIESPPDLDATLPVDTLDLINRLPDVRAVSTAGAGGTSFVSIRGGEPNFAQILINGVRVSNPSSSAGGGFDFAQLDPGLIESIQVVPASRSAIYGSDALSGMLAVQLLSAGGDTPGVAGSLTGPSEEGYIVRARASLGDAQSGAVIAASASDSGDLTLGSDIERQQLLGSFSQQIGSVRFDATVLYGETEREAFPEGSGGPLLAANRAQETRDTRFFAAGATISANPEGFIRPRLMIGYYDDNVRADTPAIFPGTFAPVPALFSVTDFDRLEATLDFSLRFADTIDVVVGSGYLSENAASIGTIDFGVLLPTGFAIERNQLSAFAEAEWRPDPSLKLSVALRQDWFDNSIGSETTAQASVEFTPGHGPLTVFAGYAEGFHRPSLFALAFPLTANPNLRPERSDAYEVGLKWRRNANELRATAFRTDYADLIDFDPVLFTTVNRSKVQIQGVTLSGNGTVTESVGWFASASWLDTQSAVPLRGRPEFYGNAGLRWRADERLSLSADIGFNHAFLESSIPTGVVRLDGRVALDLAANWQVNDAIAVTLAMRNALDEDWQDAVGFPAPGRIVTAQVSFEL